jgi:hypothetical protein
MAKPSIIWAVVVLRAEKMLAFQKKFLNRNGKLPSGTNDFDKFILDGVWVI